MIMPQNTHAREVIYYASIFIVRRRTKSIMQQQVPYAKKLTKSTNMHVNALFNLTYIFIYNLESKKMLFTVNRRPFLVYYVEHIDMDINIHTFMYNRLCLAFVNDTCLYALTYGPKS